MIKLLLQKLVDLLHCALVVLPGWQLVVLLGRLLLLVCLFVEVALGMVLLVVVAVLLVAGVVLLI